MSDLDRLVANVRHTYGPKSPVAQVVALLASRLEHLERELGIDEPRYPNVRGLTRRTQPEPPDAA